MRYVLIRRFLIFVASIAAALVIAAAVAAWQIGAFLNEPVDIPAETLEYEIRAGSSFAAISEDLASRGVISQPRLFRLYARWKGQAGAIQAGEYLIEAGTTPVELLEQFTSGDVRLYSFTIIEGWNQWELLGALHAHPSIDASLTDENWAALLAELGATVSHPEGQFLPETYRFPRGTTDRTVLALAFSLMQEVLAEEWDAREENLPIATPYEALTLASIVEKETGRADERARIAGVFRRRLEKRMRLQTDPTVIYGIGKHFNGNLTRRDLTTDTPYNTYTRHGLPPTPIAMPGRAAIHAALHPTDGKELYFVATGKGDGSHRFSETKDEHDAAVAEYLKQLRQQRRQ
ncbi:MAG: endolytic transglycosylase MltG [Woeseiaceae bacterium]|nr:endolytic transglycosylase MltG [Woeseiaceae bacterium]